MTAVRSIPIPRPAARRSHWAAMRALLEASSDGQLGADELATYGRLEDELDAENLPGARDRRVAALELSDVHSRDVRHLAFAGFDHYCRTGGWPARYAAALQADSDPAGGAMVAPVALTQDVLRRADDITFVRALATIHQVEEAQSLGAPTVETDPADADWTTEPSIGTEDTSLSLGRRELHPHPLGKLIKVSNKLLRRTAQGAGALVAERLGYKFGITFEKGCLLGTGASQPLGVFTASSSGISTARDVSTGNSTTAIGADGLIEALGSLKAPYQRKAAWALHRDAVKAVRKLKDANGQYLWNVGPIGQAGLMMGEPDLLLGRSLYVSEYVPNTFTTGKYVGIVADWSYFHIADALAMTVQRLNELYALTSQTGFIGRMESDGMPAFEEAFARVTLA